MVVRDELLEDLFHLLQATQWPTDKNNLTLAKNGANRVPKPPRTPNTTPTFHREFTRSDAPSTHKTHQQNEPKEEKEKVSSCTGFDLEALICSLEPTHNLDIQSQHDQVDPTASYTPHINDNMYLPSKTILENQNDLKHNLPPSSFRYQSKSRLVRSPSSNLGDSGLVSNYSLSRSSCGALATTGSPTEGHPQPLQRQLSTHTQQVLQLLLCEVFTVTDDELNKYYMASHRRKGADVNLNVTLETTGQGGTVTGNIRLLGGKGTHARELQPPLPPTFATNMPVDNLWSQQLLVRFSRSRKVLMENSNKTIKRSKAKKNKKIRDAVNGNDQSPPVPLSKSSLDLPLSKRLDDSIPSSKSFRSDLSPTKAPLQHSVSVSEDEAPPSTPKPPTYPSKADHNKSASATLQKGIKGIRKSFRKKKKTKDNDSDSVIQSVEHLNQVESIDGIRIENVSTPKKGATVDIETVEKSSKSPFRRLGSLKVSHSDSPFRRLNKLKRSLRVGGSHTKLYAGQQLSTIEDDCPIKSKEELITSSQPLLDKSIRLESSNPFSETSGEEFDSRNPFVSTKDYSSDLDESNPFHSDNKEDVTGLSPINNKSRSKSIRKSMRKTMSRIASVRKGKKSSKEKFPEEIPLNSPGYTEKGTQETNEQLKNLINSKEHNISAVEPGTPNTTDLKKDSRLVISPKIDGKLDSSARYEVITEELAYKMLQLQDAASRVTLEEEFDLGGGLRVAVTLKLNVSFSTKCSSFDLYRSAFLNLYKRRFTEMIPLKLPLEGVDCNATVDGEVLLKQLSIFCPISPEQIALARLLVLVEAATGKMGTPNTINARAFRKRNSPQNSVSDSTHLVVEVHQQSPASVKRTRSRTVSTSPPESPTKPAADARWSRGSGGATPEKGSPAPSEAGSATARLSTSSGGDDPPDEFVYDQKAETIMINPSDLLVQMQRVNQGLSAGLYSRSESTEALESVVCLSRWVIIHHLERLQTVFPVAGGEVTSRNLADTLRCLQLVESSEQMRERFDAETAELKLGGPREHVLRAVRKYTQLWVAALIRETTHRIDAAMKEQEAALSASATAGRPLSTASNDDRNKAPDSAADRILDDGIRAFSPTVVAEAVPALARSLVRTVKESENYKLMLYLAEKRLGNYCPQLQTGTLASHAAVPMLTYQQKEAPQSAADDEGISELVLRLDVVGNLMPVIVDFLDVAKHFYDPIFKECYELQFLEESWQVLVDGALALWRQIGASGTLGETLMNPPLKPALLPQAISAVWSLCYSYSSINRLGGGIQPQQRCEQYNSCMEDCVMCWLQLIGQRAQLQLKRDVKQMTHDTQYTQLEDLTRDTHDLIKLVVDKFESLVWPNSGRPAEVLFCLGCQLVTHLDTFWTTLDSEHKDCGRKLNTISYWSCRILDSVTELCDAVLESLDRLNADSPELQQLVNSLNLMPHKAAQNMCYKELTDVEVWVSRAASGDGGGALVQRLDEALHELYDCLAPAQPLVACLRDRILDATKAHLDAITQEEDFIQMAAVLQALREFFTNNILLEESLQAAVLRWEEQLSDAKERGRPLAELQHSYYTQRWEEQQLQQIDEQTACSSLLVNVVFVEGYGLSASIVQTPSAAAIVRAAQSSTLNNNNNSSTAQPDAGRKPPTPASKTTGMFSSMFKGATGIGSVYVKAQLVPADWFPTCNLDYKTGHCKDDPAVIDEEINFPSVLPDSNGVTRGGFLLLRLKLSRRLRSHVVSETLVPLADTAVVTVQNRRTGRHTTLPLTKPAPLHTYEPLNILKRRNDDVSSQFLSQLEQDNKGQQKAAIRGSNASLSLWAS